jgi:serine/threonine protein kinase
LASLANTTLAHRYFLKKLAGEGGMAQVYQAWDKDRSTDMAIKVIHELRFFESFLKEAATLGELAHPNIVRLYSVEKDDERKIVFLVMDWVDGKDLKGILEERKKPLSAVETSHILDCVHKALHYAHTRAVCHCDIKPANILMRNSDKQAILSDFGLAQVAHRQGSGGTLPYMAPELFLGGKVSVASDVYALGVTLYQLLTCHLPLEGRTPEELVRAHVGAKPTPVRTYNANLPDGIGSVLDQALAKDPAARQQSVTELWLAFAKHIRQAQDNLPAHVCMLCGIQGEKAGSKVPIPGNGMTIGRSAINQLQLRDPGVSREHAMLTFQRGKVYIRDRGSSLGTYVNGQRLGDKNRELAAGDRIAIGRSDIFEFRPG